MPRPSLRPVLLAVIAACGPAEPLPATASDSDTSAATSADTSAATDDTTPVTTTTTEALPTSTTASDVTTQSLPTTGDDAGTTQPQSTTGLTEPVDTTGTDSSGADTTTTGETGDDTTGTTGTTADIPDTTGGELCGDPDEADITWSLEVPPALAGQSITANCQIVSADPMGQAVAVQLSCMVQGEFEDLVLHYTLDPERDLVWTEGASAQLSYRTADAPWAREWLTVHTGNTRLWAVRADALAPPGVEVEDYYGREIKIVPACDPQPDPCGQRQGLELRISYDFGDIPTHLALRSGGWGIYGFPVPTIAWLEHASRLLDPIECDDAAPVQLDMILVDDMSMF